MTVIVNDKYKSLSASGVHVAHIVTIQFTA